MRKRLLPAALAAAGALFLAIPPVAALAASTPVLTVGSTGGTAVKVSDVLTAGLASGTSAVIATTSGGSTGVTCKNASLSATVTANPTSPGTATASVTALSLAACTSNITGVTKVNSLTLNNLPYTASVTSAGDVSVSGSIQAALSLQSVLGPVNCVYTGPTLTGIFHNADNTIVFGSNIEFPLSNGPGACPKDGFLTISIGPVTDSSQKNELVFVNPGQP
jgi:hypothetical protein